MDRDDHREHLPTGRLDRGRRHLRRSHSGQYQGSAYRTAEDTEVIIPHSKLWPSNVFNASGGKQSLLCVTNFYLNADHDGAAVYQVLTEIGENQQLPENGITGEGRSVGNALGYMLQGQDLRGRQSRAVRHDHRLNDPRETTDPSHGYRIRSSALCRK